MSMTLTFARELGRSELAENYCFISYLLVSLSLSLSVFPCCSFLLCFLVISFSFTRLSLSFTQTRHSLQCNPTRVYQHPDD